MLVSRNLIVSMSVGLLLVVALFTAPRINGSGSVSWSKTYGHQGYDEGYGLVQTIDGGYAMAGETSSFGSGDMDFYLVRTDENGTMLWEKVYGRPYDDKCYSMIQTADGGFALVGYTDALQIGLQDIWLIKTDSSGTMQWNQTYGGTGDQCALSVVQTSDGGYALAGYTTPYYGGNEDFWLVKTDSAGNIQWSMTYGGSSADDARCMIQTNDGGYALGGLTDSFGAGGIDGWLVKTDAMGNEQWNQTYGGSGDELITSVIQKADGAYVLAGITTIVVAGDNNFWLVNVDSQGNELWNKTYGGSNSDIPWHMVQTSDGGYALAGFTCSFGAGDFDYWLVKTDSSGNELWNSTYGGPSYDVARFVIQTSDGGYALIGTTYSFGAGSSDVWLVKVPLARGLGDINGDGKVDLADLVLLANAYGSKPGDTKWNPNVDINGNGVVDLADLVIMAMHYGQHYP